MSTSGISSLERWGRVDEQGTVWVRTAQGDRAVGSYPGASPEAALAYFGRKYDELAGQVQLLEQRLRTTDISPRDGEAGLARLRTAVAEANAVGDLEALAARVEALAGLVEERRAKVEAERSSAREEARATKERIVTEAESLAGSTSWKTAGDRLAALLEEWKAAPRLDKRGDDELWRRLRGARTEFDRRRRSHFAALSAQRGEVRARKERLVTEAESLAESQDWGATAARYRQLLEEWKSAGRADRETDDALWARFRTAQDRFFAARSGVFAERDEGLRGNLEQKEALAAEAEALLPVTDPRSARTALRGIQERWEAAGEVPRNDRDRVEGRLKKVETAVRAAEQEVWRRSNPEARARAESASSQLRRSIEQLEARAAQARAAGREREAAEAEAAAATRRTWLAEAAKYTSS